MDDNDADDEIRFMLENGTLTPNEIIKMCGDAVLELMPDGSRVFVLLASPVENDPDGYMISRGHVGFPTLHLADLLHKLSHLYADQYEIEEAEKEAHEHGKH